MLERYGIVTRESVLAEGVPGGFSALYGELSNLEMLGTARRGYFVEGLGGAQFALAGAVERLRGLPLAEGRYLLMAATDPANPYGAALPWPKRERDGRARRRRPSRSPGAYLLMRDGEPLLYVERGGKGILRLRPLEGEELARSHRRDRDGRARGADPEARHRARGRGGGDRLRAGGDPDRRRVQPPAAAPRGLGLDDSVTCPRATPSTASARRMNAALRGKEIDRAEAPSPRSPLHHRAGRARGPHARAGARRAASTCSRTSPAASCSTATSG